MAKKRRQVHAIVYRGHTCPQFSLATIQKRRDAIFKGLRLHYRGLRFATEVADRLLLELLGYLPRVDLPTLTESLQYLRGQKLTDAIIFETAWRLAGNLARLQAGRPVRPWSAQTTLEWAPFQIVSVIGDDTQAPAQIVFRVLAGSACPKLLTAKWSPPRRFAVAKLLGFTSSYGKFPFGVAVDFMRMQFIAVLDPALSKGYPVFDPMSLACSPSMRTRNRHLIKARMRQHTPCPRGYLHPCNQCGVSYNNCWRSVLP